MKVIRALSIVLCLVVLGAPTLATTPLSAPPAYAQPTSGAPIYFEVNVSAISPLTNKNGSSYGLETQGGSSTPIGQYFNVTITLNNATARNTPREPYNQSNTCGITGVEVHLDLRPFTHNQYGERVCEPVAFRNCLGDFQNGTNTGGVLYQNQTNALSYGVPAGLYDSRGVLVVGSNSTPSAPGAATYIPGPMATEYKVAASSPILNWTGTQGWIAWIVFEIMGAPNASEPDFYAPIPLANAYGPAVDLESTIPGEIVQIWNGTDWVPYQAPPSYQEVQCSIEHEHLLASAATWYDTLHLDTTSYSSDSTPLLIIPTNGTYIYPAGMKYSIGNGFAGNISAEVENLAAITASFDAEYVTNESMPNTKVIGMTHVTSLAPGAQVNVTITGDSSWIGVYSYNNISIWTEPVLGESDESNNRITWANNNYDRVHYLGRFLAVTVPGDMNADRKCDLVDLSYLAASYNKYVGDPKYNPNCDIKNAGKAGLTDLSYLAAVYKSGYYYW